ncbi:hypothetical protein N9L68_06720 [bacterium]|nr:hypothetical protein [bacterium]
MSIDAGKVREARSKEVGSIRDKKVYRNIPRHTATRNGWKVIRTRWTDINKGNGMNPKYRSRLVGKGFNNEQMDGLFACTPPLGGVAVLGSRSRYR